MKSSSESELVISSHVPRFTSDRLQILFFRSTLENQYKTFWNYFYYYD